MQHVAKGADDPYTRYYIACLLALRGETDRAFELLQRVHASLPALTAARAAAIPISKPPLRSPVRRAARPCPPT